VSFSGHSTTTIFSVGIRFSLLVVDNRTMSIRTKKGRSARRERLGVYEPHLWGPIAAAPKEGRMTPRGRVHRYHTIMLLGKPTQIPIGRFTVRSVCIPE
jgi:hypothetical protein